jgi:hypothetical protein
MKLIVLVLTLTTGFATGVRLQDETPWLSLDRKQDGIIINLACDPISHAHITFANRQMKRQFVSALDGRFVVDLPAGDYSVSVSINGQTEVKLNDLHVYRAKNGDVRLLVNTGFESTCPCFGPDIEDLLIPATPLVINSQIATRKPSPKP